MRRERVIVVCVGVGKVRPARGSRRPAAQRIRARGEIVELWGRGAASPGYTASLVEALEEFPCFIRLMLAGISLGISGQKIFRFLNDLSYMRSGRTLPDALGVDRESLSSIYGERLFL